MTLAIRRLMGRSLLVASIVAISVVGAALATSTVLQDDTTLFACAQRANGMLRLVDNASECRQTEEAVAWNTQGPPGPIGPPGPGGAGPLSGTLRLPPVPCDGSGSCIDNQVGGGQTVLAIPGVGDVIANDCWTFTDSNFELRHFASIAFRNTSASRETVAGNQELNISFNGAAEPGQTVRVRQAERFHGVPGGSVAVFDVWVNEAPDAVGATIIASVVTGGSGSDWFCGFAARAFIHD